MTKRKALRMPADRYKATITCFHGAHGSASADSSPFHEDAQSAALDAFAMLALLSLDGVPRASRRAVLVIARRVRGREPWEELSRREWSLDGRGEPVVRHLRERK